MADGVGAKWQELEAGAKALLAVVALVVPVLLAWGAYEKFINTEHHACSISGLVFDTAKENKPLANAYVGYREDGLVFRALATSGPDGTFSGSCKDVEEQVGQSSFVVFVTGGESRLPGLPPI